jgi:hypothetical protein
MSTGLEEEVTVKRQKEKAARASGSAHCANEQRLFSPDLHRFPDPGPFSALQTLIFFMPEKHILINLYN